MKLRPISAAIALLLTALVAPAHADDTRRPYIVQLADQPVSSYTGGIAGLAATKPVAGSKLNLTTAAAQAYSAYLAQKQQSVKALVANAPLVYDYKVVLNGFSAMLTDDEVRALQANGNVAAVTADVAREPLTNYTPAFLGLDGAAGLWSQLGGKANAGEDIVIGIIDTGIWPENPSYADRVDANGKPTFANSGTLVYDAPANWQGGCQDGEGFTVAACNNKLIGARYFKDGFDSTGRELHWTEFVSPRDSLGGATGHGGHGTHTSTTAGGNNGVAANLGGAGVGDVSGMAPRARIASYKVCWTFVAPTEATGSKNSCWGQDSVAAIERAVIDGVNVLNFSIGGGETLADPVDQAFLHAVNAGVFVAASAGNSGPGNQVAHISPWLATVAASSHDRVFGATATLGNGAQYKGYSLNATALPSSPLVRGEDARVAGVAVTAGRLCYSTGWNGGAPALDPAKVAGKVVTCDRGTNDRLDKSLAVKEAGGVGMILVDNGGGLVADPHVVPTVHISAADGALVKTYATTAGATAAISRFTIGASTTPAPVITGFSSRGPNRYDANVLKPDLTAPGANVLAGVTPDLTAAQRANLVSGTLSPVPLAWALYDGTSMSSPHVAGIAALLKQLHPTWSPAAIKSAMMTTATPTFTDNLPSPQTGTLPWAQGAGHVNPVGSVRRPADGKAYNPGGAADPGLVFDLGALDYKKYQCGAGISAQCASGNIAGYNLNLPSITVGNTLGSTDVLRTVTNVGAGTAPYTASATLPGYSVTVSPASLTLAPNASASFTVKLTRTTAPANVWQFGELVLTDGSHIVRMPVSAREGKQVVAKDLAKSTRTTSTTLLSVNTGFTGRLGVAAGGLKEISRTAQTVRAFVGAPPADLEASAAACRANVVGTVVTPLSVPADAVVLSVELFDRDTSSGNGNDDLDLVLLAPDGSIAASSLNGGSNESVMLNSPAAGAYRACVVGYAPADKVATDYTLSSAVVGRADVGGNLRLTTPGKVYAGSAATVTASWSGLATGKRYLGGAQFLNPAGAVAATTALLVETNDPLPLVLSGPRPKSAITK
ncbi:S8 family serine peptidase [Oxalobacteraceae bacterium OTU3CAMAD1]|nr:S8 family serine peptidase [Oxalobacteraceae bacterium OTU3CAMAD1]